MKSRNFSIWVQHTKYILIQNLVENTKMKNADIILENFLQSAP